jgi:cell division protein FtsB
MAAMVIRRRIRSILVPLALYAVSAGVVGYFMHSARIGNRGLDAKQSLKVEIYELGQNLDAARTEHQMWDRRLALMRADQVDRDLLEERARIMLGRVHKNDLVIVGP